MKISELEQQLTAIRNLIGDREVAMVTTDRDEREHYRIDLQITALALTVPHGDESRDICAIMWDECYDARDNDKIYLNGNRELH